VELAILRHDNLDFSANGQGQQASPEGYVVFPHLDPGDHRCHYFSARALNPADPKDKSRNLPGERQVYWGLHPSDPDLAIVEGQADLLSLVQAQRSGLALCGVGGIPPDDLERARRRRTKRLMLDNDTHLPGLAPEEVEKRLENQARITARICGQLGPLTMIVAPLPAKDFNDVIQPIMTISELQEGKTKTSEQINAALKAEKDSLKAIERLADELLHKAHPWIDAVLEQAKTWQPDEIDQRLRESLALIHQLPKLLQKRYRQKFAETLGLSDADVQEWAKETVEKEKKPRPDPRPALARIKEGQLWFGDEPLINCAPHITAELSRDNGVDTPSVLYAIEGSLPGGERLEALEVLAEELDAMRWLSAWGARVWPYLSPGKTWLIARAMKELAAGNGLKRERVYAYSGWTVRNGQPAFLTTSGAITADGHDPAVRVDLGDNNLRYYNLPAPPQDARQAVQASLGFLDLAPLSVTAPLWAAMYAAPLGEFIHLNAVLWVYGGSQSRKSTIAMLALTHFGPDFIIAQNHQYRAPAEWISTDTNLEGQLFACKDLPFVIDDYAPQHTSPALSRRIAATANRVIRTVGNRSARGRANADLSERKARPPRGLVISTAELPMVGQSIEGRMIYVTVNKGDIPISDNGQGLLDTAQALGGGGEYALAMSGYIRYLAQHWETVRENVRREYAASDLYARARFSGEQARLMDYYATLAAAVQMALRYALHVRAITPAQAEARRTALLAAIEALLLNQSQRIAQQSPALRFFDALYDLQTQGRAYLAPKRPPGPGAERFIPPLNAQLIGWYGHDRKGEYRLYLLTNACLQLVKEYWERAGETFDMLPDALRRQLAQAGLLIQKDPRQFEPSVYIPSTGQTQRVAVVDVEQTSQLLNGVSLWPEKIISHEVEDDY